MDVIMVRWRSEPLRDFQLGGHQAYPEVAVRAGFRWLRRLASGLLDLLYEGYGASARCRSLQQCRLPDLWCRAPPDAGGPSAWRPYPDKYPQARFGIPRKPDASPALCVGASTSPGYIRQHFQRPIRRIHDVDRIGRRADTSRSARVVSRAAACDTC